MFKIVKLRTPIRDDKLISLNLSTLFDYQSSNLWTKCCKSEIDFTTSIQYVKRKLKRSLLDFQFNHGEDWHNFNFDVLTIFNSNYVLHIHSNLIQLLQNTNLISNTLCNYTWRKSYSTKKVIIRTNRTYCIFVYLQLPSNILLVNVNLNDHFWISNISMGKTGTT